MSITFPTEENSASTSWHTVVACLKHATAKIANDTLVKSTKKADYAPFIAKKEKIDKLTSLV